MIYYNYNKGDDYMEDKCKFVREKILNDVKKENLILDLRGCGGGYLKQCVDICDLFLPERDSYP